MEPALHPDCEPFAFLLGTWRGEGEGEWPPGRPFTYSEEMVFEHVGDPFIMYSQTSRTLEDASPLHFERGFLRGAGPGRVELVLAHPLGIAEIAEGTLEGASFEVASTHVPRTATGSPVTELRRKVRVENDVLTYELRMAMEDVPIARHLTGRLTRV